MRERVMTDSDSLSGVERNRKEAEKFSELAKTASFPFLRSYYWHIALRYLSQEGELRPVGTGNSSKQGGSSTPERGGT
jgi:hypothetical protein